MMKHTLCTKLNAQVIQGNLKLWETLGGEIVTFDTATCLVSNLPLPESNKIFVKNPGILSQNKVVDLIGFFEEKNLPHIWLVPKSDKDAMIEKHLRIHGFSPFACIPSMIRSSNRIEPKTSTVHIQQIQTVHELALVNSIWQKSFCISNEAAIKHLELLQNYYRTDKSSIHFYLASSNDVAIGTGWLFFDKACAGIYNIATVPEARKQGIAHSMMQRLVEQALHMGYNKICLSALGAAQRIYEKFGFYTVREYRMFKKGTFAKILS